MMVRFSKIVLVAAVAFFFTLVVFNNLTDYDSNRQFVHHVLLMDSTFPANHGLWRAIRPEWAHVVFYDSIILWESVAMALTWAGALRLLRALRQPPADFARAKGLAVAGLTAGLLLWFIAFLSVGGEWFLMWQSQTWNGQQAAFRMFVAEGVVLVLLLMPDADPSV